MAEKIIKNPARNSNTDDTAEHQKYVPQYRILGVSPESVNFSNREEPLSLDEGSVVDFKLKTAPIETDPTEINSEDISDNFSIPNIGNSMDHTWTNSAQEENKKDPISLKSDEKYILLAKEEILLVGSLMAVEEEVRKIFYKEHQIKKYNKISVEDLVVLKKMKIKIGIFVE
jgi:hypothetical protein